MPGVLLDTSVLSELMRGKPSSSGFEALTRLVNSLFILL